jgi:hypothetical protein
LPRIPGRLGLKEVTTRPAPIVSEFVQAVFSG